MRSNVPPFGGAVVLAVGLLTAGCGSGDPLSVSCSSFLAKSDQEQLKLAEVWGRPNRDQADPASELVAPTYQQQLADYCSGHPDVELKDIELRIR